MKQSADEYPMKEACWKEGSSLLALLEETVCFVKPQRFGFTGGITD
jgi:hypothetical protein